jgi:beta-lactamase class A
MQISRSAFLAGAIPLLAAAAPPVSLESIETRVGGRLGVFAVDSQTGRRLEHRAGERFPMCSTFKLLAAGAVLARVDRAEERLNRRIRYSKADLLEYAPVTRAHVAQGSMSVADLCAAAIELSDNTAANLLLQSLGGPHAVTQFARSLGDPSTRLDRMEPALNTAIPGDPRDTTTPANMAQNLRRLLTGTSLTRNSRGLLYSWLAACKTGEDCLRAGIPASWREGDKTGSGAHGTRNDVAILQPPNRKPIFVAAYLTQSRVSAAESGAALASVGRLIAHTFA